MQRLISMILGPIFLLILSYWAIQASSAFALRDILALSKANANGALWSIATAYFIVLPMHEALKVLFNAYLGKYFGKKTFGFTNLIIAIIGLSLTWAVAKYIGVGPMVATAMVFTTALASLTLGMSDIVILNLIPKVISWTITNSRLNGARKALLEKCEGIIGERQAKYDNVAKGVALERLAADLYRSMGNKVYEQKDLKDILPRFGDQGLDLVIEKDNKHYIIQCKNFKKPITNKQVQELCGAMQYYKRNFNIVGGVLITTSTFKKSATDLAEQAGIQLVDMQSFSAMLRRYNVA
ncbi:restriction endonuclease [Bdellovibrio sp. BCCA]|uniref:restriction endonuclease n=1 Tax=Bdellovibrio sp. BCCA TaxID=3136281 RepID=UPI0030F1D477